jgi:hypothetical protein
MTKYPVLPVCPICNEPITFMDDIKTYSYVDLPYVVVEARCAHVDSSDNLIAIYKNNLFSDIFLDPTHENP